MRRVVSYLLGAFVCIELVYLPLVNFLQRIPRRPDPLPEEILGRYQCEGRVSSSDMAQSTIDATGKACDRWAELTAQGQGWSLFAPRFGGAGTFLMLDVTTDDGKRVELRSRFEPADPSHYLRFDVVNYRLFYREMSFALLYSTWTPESFDKEAEDWRKAIDEHVTVLRRSMSAYVRWRLSEELPGTTVRDVIVNVRVFLPAKPDQSAPRPEAMVVPLAKWTEEGVVPFDPTAQGLVLSD